ncbi:MAG: class I SAM-dependent methyltransferase [Hamadaea sp.]|nr:class I SAM-dependent methyltransferase [Hamadaea sp.]
MADLDHQVGYWTTTGAAKTFTHPLELTWLDGVDRGARILDYGCGYGRLTAYLRDHGFAHVEGADIAPALIDRARAAAPDLTFHLMDEPPALPHPDDALDVVVLFAVLTCVPDDGAQRDLIAELRRVLRPGGLLYVSDLPLQDDARNRERYERFARTYGTYGVFETGDGGVCRHHDRAWLADLLGEFTVAAERTVVVPTMNGNEVTAVQLLARA